MFVKGFFLGDVNSGLYRFKSGIKYGWFLNKLDFHLVEKLQRFCKEFWVDINFKTYDFTETSQVYRISSGTKN